MKVMFDANIALDAFQQREPHQLHSAEVLSKSLRGDIQGYFSAHVVTTIFYVLRKATGKERAAATTRWLVESFDIATCDRDILAEAIDCGMVDFEDAVVAYSAQRAGCDYVVTRNESDFSASPIPAITPKAFLDRPLPDL